MSFGSLLGDLSNAFSTQNPPFVSNTRREITLLTEYVAFGVVERFRGVFRAHLRLRFAVEKVGEMTGGQASLSRLFLAD